MAGKTFVRVASMPSPASTTSPIRDYRTILHVRRRRWKDADGKSHSKDWQLVAQGTRHSVEFAAFLKEFIGYVPDYSSFAPETVSHQG